VSPLSWPVLLGTLLVASPALYAAQVSGTLSPDVALVRVLICMAGVWLVCSIVASLVEGAVAANKVAEEAELAALAAETAELPVVPDDGLASDAA
jgi:preprotein translocase subunit SecG